MTKIVKPYHQIVKGAEVISNEDGMIKTQVGKIIKVWKNIKGSFQMVESYRADVAL